MRRHLLSVDDVSREDIVEALVRLTRAHERLLAAGA